MPDISHRTFIKVYGSPYIYCSINPFGKFFSIVTGYDMYQVIRPKDHKTKNRDKSHLSFIFPESDIKKAKRLAYLCKNIHSFNTLL